MLRVGLIAMLALLVIQFIVGSSLGLLFILMAGSGGLTFLNRGGEDKESFTMALGFIFAMIAYGVTYYKTKEN